MQLAQARTAFANLIPMAEPATCGKGLAENSGMSARMSEVIAAVAANLEAHMPVLDLDDPAARTEHEVYATLARRHREVAASLHALSGEMAGHVDLPAAPHDDAEMMRPEILAAFEQLARAEDALLTLLQDTAAWNARALEQMRAALAAEPPG